LASGGGGRGNVLHHVKGEANCPGGGSVRGNMFEEGECPVGKYPDPIATYDGGQPDTATMCRTPSKDQRGVNYLVEWRT